MLENKIPPLLVAALCAAAMWVISLITPKPELPSFLQLAGSAFLLFVGGFFCIAGIIAFRQARTTVNPLNPETASTLVNSGIYRITRNPMYVGFAFTLLAWAWFLGSPWALTGVLFFILYMNRFQIKPEERALLALFQGQYKAYLSSVRRWL